VDAVIAGDLALLLTDRASGSAVRAIRISDGADQGLVTLPANEKIQIGVDPMLVHGRLVYLVDLNTGSGALRSVDLPHRRKISTARLGLRALLWTSEGVHRMLRSLDTSRPAPCASPCASR